MAWEVECILRFEDYPPTQEEVEEALECVVVEWSEEEV